MIKYLKILCIITLLFYATACTIEDTTTDNYNDFKNPEMIKVYNGVDNEDMRFYNALKGTIFKFQDDKNICYIYSNYKAGGISCVKN